MQAIVDPVYFKRTQIISPGVVGSVGDTLGGVRLKQSTPDMAMRYDPSFESPITGSNVQDGYSYSYTSGGGPARTIEKTMANRGFKTQHGLVYQDLRAPDTTLEPIMGSTGRYPWYNKIATIYEAKRTGDLFLPLPGPYGPTDITRGSQVPRITATIGPTDQDISQIGKQMLPGEQQSMLQKRYKCTKPDGSVTYKLVPSVVESRPSIQVPTQTPTQAPTAPMSNQSANQTTPDLNFSL